MYCSSLTCASLLRPFLFRQLFDQESSTYTYLLADTETKEALLIDPVLEQVDRDAQLIKELGLDLKYGMNTHVHADHVTGTGMLRKKYFPQMKSVLGAQGNDGAIADVKLKNGEVFTMGVVKLENRSTPGHTNGCHSFVAHDQKMVFTGDAVLIRGCGRTDFQEGNAENLYHNVWNQILSLPEDFLIYPAHDYKGRSVSSVCEEKKFNPRLTKNVREFVELMNNLNLPYPKKIDLSVPMNRVCGLHELASLPEGVEKPVSVKPQGGNCSGEAAPLMASSGLASVEVLKAAASQNAKIVDVRGDPGEDIKTSVAPGAIHCPWNREQNTMPVEGLPADKNALMIVHCAKGSRAALAIDFLKARGYTNLVNGGGPFLPELWEVYSKR